MVTDNTQFCNGCGICAVVCPKSCISVDLDVDGFYKPRIDNLNACIQCNLCDKYCIKHQEIIEAKPLGAFSVISENPKILASTSSGGLAYELATQGIEQNKKVCAVVYDYGRINAKHISIDSIDGLEETKGSKYFQSYTVDAFKKIFDGNEWIVFGTPCQIAAIDRLATEKKIRDKLLLVDFFCHGVPSMYLWRKYIEEQGGQEIEKIYFRSKEFGWRNFSLKFQTKNGDSHFDFQGNIFYRLFFSNTCLNESCYQCNFKGVKSYADIRIGDFWGGNEFIENNTGVSGCLVFSEKGRNAVSRLINCSIKDQKLDSVLDGQMMASPKKPKCYRKVIRKLRSKKTLKYIYKVTLFPYKLKRKIYSMFSR